MAKAIRITILMTILIFVAVSTYLTQQRTTDWDLTLRVRVYPINADGHPATDAYIRSLSPDNFEPVEAFMHREAKRYDDSVYQPVQIELGPQIVEQPPKLAEAPNVLDAILWSLKMRWWAGSVTDEFEDYQPDVRIFVRYHEPNGRLMLEDSVGVRKGMFGIVNAYTGRRNRGRNQVVFTHELLHTIGASDKYDPRNNQPIALDGLGEPDRSPLYPQRYAEIMGGRVALSATTAEIPSSLAKTVIGQSTAREIRLIE
ncbi:MAG: hypothetical protein AB8F65_13345 [Woeseiaceae bacterium]